MLTADLFSYFRNMDACLSLCFLYAEMEQVFSTEYIFKHIHISAGYPLNAPPYASYVVTFPTQWNATSS